jgi:hypothetical protein
MCDPVLARSWTIAGILLLLVLMSVADASCCTPALSADLQQLRVHSGWCVVPTPLPVSATHRMSDLALFPPV